MWELVKQYIEKIEDTWFWWWVKNYKVSFLLITLLVAYGTFALVRIPKESTPDIPFGIVQITTVYPGANPVDIDSIITQKIEDEIENMQEIDTIDSRSSLGVSSVTVTLKSNADTKQFISDVKTKLDSIPFIDDIKDPLVSEISSDNAILFQAIAYAPKKDFTLNHVKSLGVALKKEIKWKGGIVDVTVAGVSDDSDYDLTILLNDQALENYNLTISQVVGAIRNYNQNLPLGNHELGDFSYDYRIDNEISSIDELNNIPISINGGVDHIKLSDITTIKREYKSTAIVRWGIRGSADNHAVSITVFKEKNTNVFSTAKSAKSLIESTLKKPQYQGLSFEYTTDMSDIIIDDYKSLGSNAVSSVILVLAITALFIGLRQSLIATLGMIISFFITFIVLSMMGMTLNFLTNFSLILAFGSWIDTVIVFIEAARENMKRGYNPKSAILLAVNTYKTPNINTSLINLIVFIPMLVLPGVTGKFLSYIPITIFTTLLGSLFLALTVNNALFIKFNKKRNYYYEEDETSEMIMSDVERKLLEEERKGKEVRKRQSEPRFEKALDKYLAVPYIHILKQTISNKKRRRASIRLPVMILIATFIFLSPRIWFKLFPSGDNPFITYAIEGKQGQTTDSMAQAVSWVDRVIASIPEVKSYEVTINKHVVDLTIILTKKDERKRDSFQVEEDIKKGLAYLKEEGYKVEGKVQAGWPPVGKAVGIKLVAENTEQLNELKQVSEDFEAYLRSLTGTINVGNSSSNTPWQFSVSFNKEKLAELGLTPQDFQWELYAALNGTKAWNIQIENIERDIVVKVASFDEGFSPDHMRNFVVQTRKGEMSLASVAEISLDPALASITRVDGDLTITVDADLESGLAPTAFQPQLIAYADKYDFPSGISYKASGENQENADLIQATIMAFFVALFLAFAILVYQFNSFSKPAIVLYSIITALLGANIGLYVTGNPYSMSFGIGFISLIGVIVNTAIFLVDRINENLKNGVSIERAIVEAGTVRFKPIIISTVTTILGIGSVVTQDEFYAWLGWTVIFGLLFSSVITLIAVPNLFYAVYKRKEARKQLADQQ